jgi:hypothetical protein
MPRVVHVTVAALLGFAVSCGGSGHHATTDNEPAINKTSDDEPAPDAGVPAPPRPMTASDGPMAAQATPDAGAAAPGTDAGRAETSAAVDARPAADMAAAQKCDATGACGAGTHHIYFVWDASTAGCRARVEEFFKCLLGRTNYNQLAAAYPRGRAMTYGGAAVLNKNCPFTHTYANLATDSATFQCVVDQTGWDVNKDDVIVYYPSYPSCVDGRNHWGVPVKVDGQTVDIEVGFVFSGSVCSCQTAIGMHEAYEASSNPSSGDCCNGQTWSPLHANCGQNKATFGWYDLSCGGTTYKAQMISPTDNMYDTSGCQKVAAK